MLDKVNEVLDFWFIPSEAILDKWAENNIQFDADIKEKFEGFGFNVIEVNGHDIEALIYAFNSAKDQKDMPSVIIAHTIKGKGVSFMEKKAEWHGKAPSQEQYEEAINELKLQHIIG